MRITELSIAKRRIRFNDAFPVSYESHSGTEHVFVRLTTEKGIRGYGEGTALPLPCFTFDRRRFQPFSRRYSVTLTGK